MFCFHDYKRPVGIIHEGSGGSKYTRVVFFCPDCVKTITRELENVHMDEPTVRALFPVKERPKPAPSPVQEKFHVGSCYVGIIIGMVISLFAGISLAGYLTH